MKKIFKEKYFLFFILFLFIGCSLINKKKKDSKAFGGTDFVDSLVAKVQPKWHRGLKRFRLESGTLEPVKHFFFDVDPMINMSKMTLNAVVLTPADSKHLFRLDMKSGQKYIERDLCPSYDFYKRYNKTIRSPNFSLGFVPRYLDQLGTPQKILVFGEEEFIKKHHNSHYFDVRVVGGFIERVCPRGGCADLNDWSSRLVLVGVKGSNRKFEDVKNIDDLSKLVDWPYARAFVENAQGKNRVTNVYYGAYKMGAIVSAKKALEYAMKMSTAFSLKRMKSLKRSCYGLYDLAWKTLGKKSKKSFERKFSDFFQKYHGDFKTCTQYVYSSNINNSHKHHWFMAYLEGFFKLHALGYSYRCDSRSWVENLVMPDGKLLYPLKGELKNCSERAMKLAFQTMPQVFEANYKRGRESYKYIDYDPYEHKKVYSWVALDNKRMECAQQHSEFFPSDISWK